MILEPHFVTYIRIFFGRCQVTFPYREILPFFGQCHVTFPYMERLSFCGKFVQKAKISCLSDLFAQKTTQQSDCSSNVSIDSQFFHKLYKKQPLDFGKHNSKIYSE